jgi:predicted PurR-regulated permease PerM
MLDSMSATTAVHPDPIGDSIPASKAWGADSTPEAAAGASATAVAVMILCAIAIVAALYLARAFFVPLLLGILASYALAPLVDGLGARGIPRAIGAAVVLLVLTGAGLWAVMAMEDDASALVSSLPEAARKVRQHLRESRTVSGPTSMAKIQEAATELQGAATDAAEAKPVTAHARARPGEPESAWLRDFMLAQSALLFTVAAQAPVVLLLCYFLLAAGPHFRRKLVQLVGPSLSRKKEAVHLLDEIDLQVQRYLLGIVAGNVLVALGTWLAFEALGVERAGVWAAAAGLLHFVPYLGPALFAGASGIAAFMQFGAMWPALAVAGASLAVAFAVGSVAMTWLQSRFARVNAAVLFIALLFFGWLWGVWGLLLGAPLLAIAKAICDRVTPLHAVGELLGQ